MTSIILAGGRSSRFAQNKVLQTIGGKSLIQWVIDRLALISTEIIIVTARGELIASSWHVRTKTVADIYSNRGPLAGIHSGLNASSNPCAVVVGCDMPFLNVTLLQYMTQFCPQFDAVVPRLKDKVEPLCAVYSKTCLSSIQTLLKQDERRISRLFSLVGVRCVDQDEIDDFDPEHLSFFNINSQADLERARKLADEKGWLS